jgi:hypothetical protein
VIASGDTYVFPPEMDEPAARTAWMLPPPAKVFVALEEDLETILVTFTIVGTIPQAFEHRSLRRCVDVFVMHRFL